MLLCQGREAYDNRNARAIDGGHKSIMQLSVMGSERLREWTTESNQDS